MIITVDGLTIQILSFTTQSNETLRDYMTLRNLFQKRTIIFFYTKQRRSINFQTHLPIVKLIGSLVLPLERAVMV
jgi:hypothetical protein